MKKINAPGRTLLTMAGAMGIILTAANGFFFLVRMVVDAWDELLRSSPNRSLYFIIYFAAAFYGFAISILAIVLCNKPKAAWILQTAGIINTIIAAGIGFMDIMVFIPAMLFGGFALIVLLIFNIALSIVYIAGATVNKSYFLNKED